MFLKVLETIFPSGSQNASNTSPAYKSSQHIERPVPTSQWPVCLQSFVLVIQGLGTALLALIDSLLVLLTNPQCLHSSGACSLLVYLDAGLSLLAVIVSIATAMPKVRLCVFMSRPKQQFDPLIKSSLRRRCLLQLYPDPRWLLPLFHWQLSPGVPVWTAAATGHTSTHLCIWSWTEDWEHPWCAGCARPTRLAVNWIIHSGLCPYALPCWLSNTQVRWDTVAFVLVVLTFYTSATGNSQFWKMGTNL